MISEKRGVLVKVLIFLIIGAVCVFILFSFAFKFFSPSFDVQDETAKNYLASLEKAIEKVDKEGYAEFDVYVNPGEIRYFLVDFGNKNYIKDWLYKNESYTEDLGDASVGYTNLVTATRSYYLDFLYSKPASNTLCICYNKEGFSEEDSNVYHTTYRAETTCKRCVNLDFPADFSGGFDEDIFELGVGSFILRKNEGTVKRYFFETGKQNKKDCVGPTVVDKDSCSMTYWLEAFLKLGLEKSFMTTCVSGKCDLQVGDTQYTYNKKTQVFNKTGGTYLSVSSVTRSRKMNCSSYLNNWSVANDLFRAFYNLVTEKDGSSITRFDSNNYNQELASYLGYYSQKFILESSGRSFLGISQAYDYRLTWQNYVWTLEIRDSQGRWRYITLDDPYDDLSSLGYFYDKVSSGYQDKVYFYSERPVVGSNGVLSYEGSSSKVEIGWLIGGNDELENGELPKLYDEFLKRKKSWQEAYYPEENFLKLKEKVSGKKINVGGHEVVVSLIDNPMDESKSPNDFIVKFSFDDGRIYGLAADQYAVSSYEASQEIISPITFYEYSYDKWSEENSWGFFASSWDYSYEDVKQDCYISVIYDFMQYCC